MRQINSPQTETIITRTIRNVGQGLKNLLNDCRVNETCWASILILQACPLQYIPSRAAGKGKPPDTDNSVQGLLSLTLDAPIASLREKLHFRWSVDPSWQTVCWIFRGCSTGKISHDEVRKIAIDWWCADVADMTVMVVVSDSSWRYSRLKTQHVFLNFIYIFYIYNQTTDQQYERTIQFTKYLTKTSKLWHLAAFTLVCLGSKIVFPSAQ